VGDVGLKLIVAIILKIPVCETVLSNQR